MKKTSISNPIVAFNPDRSTLPRFTSVRDPHVTVVYIDQGDPDGSRTNPFISAMNIQPRTSPVVPQIIPKTKKGPLLLFSIQDDWYAKFAKFLMDTLARNQITAGLGHGNMHISLAYADQETLEQLWQQYDLDNWQGVTMFGPYVYDATGVMMQRAVTSSAPMDSDRWLELAQMTQGW